MPYLTLLKKVRKNSCILSKWCLFWADTNLPVKFHGNIFSSFCAITMTNQPTRKKKQMRTSENMTLGKVKKKNHNHNSGS